MPENLATAVANACRSLTWVRAAYVAGVHQSAAYGTFSRELLAVALEPDSPCSDPSERKPDWLDGVVEAMHQLPEGQREGGVRLLAKAALPAWRKRAVPVYQAH